MLKYLIPFVFLLSSLQADYDLDKWLEVSKIYVTRCSPTQQQVIFVNSYTEVGAKAGIWHVVDLSEIVPRGTKCVNLAGLLIITHGQTQEIANMLLYFRQHGYEGDHIYIGQVCEACVTGGQRSPISVWVPLSDDLKFEFMWTRKNPGQWPEFAAYGINLSLNAFGI